MATPFFQQLTTTINITHNSPGSVTFLTKDATGAAINVSSGYTLNFFSAQPTSNPNQLNGGAALTADVTAAFSTTGVTLSWTAAQATAMSALLQSLNNQYALALSNDSGTTQSVLAIGSLNYTSANSLI